MTGPRRMMAVALALVVTLTGCAAADAGAQPAHRASGPAARFSPAGSASAAKAPSETPVVDVGSLHSYSVTGATSHYTGAVEVWTPPAYTSRSAGYPVLMALHGWPGSPRMLPRNLRLLDELTSASDHHQISQPVVVIPAWGNDVDTECTDGDAAHRVETWLSVDLPAWVHQHFRVRMGAMNWATYGFSAGAYCASMLAMRHPTVFGAAISLSGYSSVWFEKSYQPFRADSPQGRRYNLVDLARSRPPVSIYLLTDKGDQRSYPSLAPLITAARPPLRLTTVFGTGGHTVALWIPQTALALAWLGHTLTGFSPG